MKSYLPILLVTYLLTACSNQNKQSSFKVEQNYQYTFSSVGYAPIDVQPGNNFDMQMLNAIKASKLEAYKEMAEQIYGVLITAKGSAQGAKLMDDEIETQVKGLVRGARVLKSYHEGNVYITELELGMETLPFLKATEFEPQGGLAIKAEEVIYY